MRSTNTVSTLDSLSAILVKAYGSVCRFTDKTLVTKAIKSGYLEKAVIEYFGGTTCHISTLVGKVPYVFNLLEELDYDPSPRSRSSDQTLAHLRVINMALVYAVLYVKTEGSTDILEHKRLFRKESTAPTNSIVEDSPKAVSLNGVDMSIKTKYLEVQYSAKTQTYTVNPKTSKGKAAAAKLKETTNV